MVNFAYELGQYPEMLQLCQAAQDRVKKNPADKVYGRVYLAWALARTGRLQKRINSLTKSKKMSRGFPDTSSYRRLCFRPRFLRRRGRLEGARRIQKAYRAFPPNHEPNIFYGITLFRNGMIGEAIDEFQRLTRGRKMSIIISGLHSRGGNGLAYPGRTSPLLAGRCVRKTRESDRALNEYRKFLDIWKDADFRLGRN